LESLYVGANLKFEQYIIGEYLGFANCIFVKLKNNNIYYGLLAHAEDE